MLKKKKSRSGSVLTNTEWLTMSEPMCILQLHVLSRLCGPFQCMSGGDWPLFRGGDEPGRGGGRRAFVPFVVVVINRYGISLEYETDGCQSNVFFRFSFSVRHWSEALFLRHSCRSMPVSVGRLHHNGFIDSVTAYVYVSPTSQRFYRFNDCLCVAYITTVLSIQWLPMSVCRLHHNGFIDSVTAYVCVSPTSQRFYRFNDCLCLCVAYITTVLSIH